MSWRLTVQGRLGSLNLDLRLEAESGPLVVIGPNGAGKSTLLRSIAGSHHELRGRVAVGNQVFVDSERQILVPAHERGIGYVPQNGRLFPHMSVIDNVRFGLKTPTEITPLMQRLRIDELSETRPSELSGGETQRVALARALAVDPALLVMDEPLASLDPTSRRHLRRFLVDEVVARPAVIVSHDVDDILAFGGTVVVLEAGRVAQSGTADLLAANPATNFVREFFDV